MPRLRFPHQFEITISLGNPVCQVDRVATITMRLFIGSLAFPDSADKAFDERIGILAGSLISAILGYLFLRLTLRPGASEGTAESEAEHGPRA